MATNTTKLALTKPDGTDLVDIAVLNANADKIDAASGATICTSTTRPASPWNGQVIFETDTFNALVYRTSTSSWTTIGGSTVSSDPPASAGSGNLWWDSDNGKLYIYYADANSSQWVAAIPGSGANQAATNHLLNSDFSINQRAFTSTTGGGYGFDRWSVAQSGGTVTYSSQAFTPGVGPAAGIESANYARIVTTGQSAAGDLAYIGQAIEGVRILAGKTITVSFWAKAASGTPKIGIDIDQWFGTGGSPSAEVQIAAGAVTLSTSWARYSVTVTLPSLTSKTIGTDVNTNFTKLNLWVSAGATYATRASYIGIQSNTFDFWGVQVEENPQASAYKRNQPNLQAELAACQRYYYRSTNNSGYAYGRLSLTGISSGATSAVIELGTPVTMRAKPTAVDSSSVAVGDTQGAYAVTALTLASECTESVVVLSAVVASGLATYRPVKLVANNSLTAYVGVSADI